MSWGGGTVHGAGTAVVSGSPVSALTTRLFAGHIPAASGADGFDVEAGLVRLGGRMTWPNPGPNGARPSGREGGIGAAYTYFAQFVGHDLTFNPTGGLALSTQQVGRAGCRLDLASLYGAGPDEQPYLFVDGRRFVLGRGLSGQALGAPVQGWDLPRSETAGACSAHSRAAVIPDPRNDRNVILAQLHALVLRFHNRLADLYAGQSFDQVRQEVRFHYQWIILHDLLPAVVSTPVLHSVLPHVVSGHEIADSPAKLKVISPMQPFRASLEFLLAAYQYGHTVVRSSYRINDDVVLPLFAWGERPDCVIGFGPPKENWAIDWPRMIDVEPRWCGSVDDDDPRDRERMQRGFLIDTSLQGVFKTALPAVLARDPPPLLPARTLLRGWRAGLPSGQEVARAMGQRPLDDDDILIGAFTGQRGDILGNVAEVGGTGFTGCCPLWAYVLAETHEETVGILTTQGVKPIPTRKLGWVGGRIVAETLAGAILADPTSFVNLDPRWRPDPSLTDADGRFGLRDLIIHAQSRPS